MKIKPREILTAKIFYLRKIPVYGKAYSTYMYDQLHACSFTCVSVKILFFLFNYVTMHTNFQCDKDECIAFVVFASFTLENES